jgi:hypothetical protein
VDGDDFTHEPKLLVGWRASFRCPSMPDKPIAVPPTF